MKRMDRKLAQPLQRNQTFVAANGPKYFEKLAEAAPQFVLLTCSCARTSPHLPAEDCYVVSNAGGSVGQAQATLDQALRGSKIPLLLIVGHSACPLVKAALAEPHKWEPTAVAVLEPLAGAFAEGRARTLRNNVLKHIDHQVSLALTRYGDLVKANALSVVGALLDDEDGRLWFVNYNGLKGKDKLKECLGELLPDQDGEDFCL